MVVLEGIDQKLLGLLQVGFPLAERPYAALGLKLGISGDEVIRRVRELKERGIVRQIGPVLDARKLGYQSTLVAMKIAPQKLEKAEAIVRAHPGVSHGYERDYSFNVWITLSVPARSDIDAGLEKLAAATGASAAFSLPALKVFKLRAYFGAEDETAPAPTGDSLSATVKLSGTDRAVVNALQQDLPLVAEPFVPLASRLNMGTADFLARCLSLKERGIIRRFGAAINHRNAGYQANAMSCWVVPPEMVDAAGQKLASLNEVSHCYERKTTPLWRHNLFAMVHGHARADCERVIAAVSAEAGLRDNVTLFSTREFKKVRIKYVV